MEIGRKLLMVMAAGDDSGDQKSIWETVQEWLAQMLQYYQDALKYLQNEVQVLFPPQSTPEILSFCLRFGVTVLLPLTLALLLICLCCQCSCWVVEGSASCCCRRRRRRRNSPKDLRPEDPSARTMEAGGPSSQPETPLLST